MQREDMKRARDSTDSSSDADLPQKRSRHHSPPPLGTIRALSSFFKSSRDSLNSSTSTLNLDGKFDLFHTACGQSLWQGDRTENQDQIYVDDNFDVEQFKHFLIHTEKEVLKHLTSSWDLPESLRNSAKIESCNSLSVTAVFDGHGPAGLSASSLAREFLPQYLQLNSPILCLDEESLKRAVATSIFRVQKQLLEQASTKDPNQREYGTTALISILWGGRSLTVANGENIFPHFESKNCILNRHMIVGDSRAVMYRKTINGSRVELYSIPMSEDHSFRRKGERDRIIKANGRIFRKPGSEQSKEVERVVPNPAVFPKEAISEQMLSLTMSRSLGHYTLCKYGVISEPEFETLELQDGDLLVMGSDGLWEVLDNDAVLHILQTECSQKSSQEISDILLERVQERVKQKKQLQQNYVADNTSIVVVRFNLLETLDIDIRDILPDQGRLTPTPSVTDSNSSTPTRSPSSNRGSLSRQDTQTIEDE